LGLAGLPGVRVEALPADALSFPAGVLPPLRGVFLVMRRWYTPSEPRPAKEPL